MTLATEPVRMMEPPSFNSGRAFWTVNSAPFTLMLNSPVEMFLGDAAQGGKLSEACIGEDNVDSPPLRLDGFVEPIKVSQLGDVSLDAGYVVPNGFHRLIKLLLATACDEYVGPRFDEELRRSEAYSCGATSNDCHFSL